MATSTTALERFCALFPKLETGPGPGPDLSWEVDSLLSAASELHQPSRDPLVEGARKIVLRMKPAELVRAAQAFRKWEDERRREHMEERNRQAAIAKAGRGPRRVGAGSGAWTLRQEHTLCGKARCDKPHGPYWYGYRSIAGKTKKIYIGKKKPTLADLERIEKEVQVKAEARAAAAAKKRLGKGSGRSRAAALPKKGKGQKR